jgi:dTDP-4-amino-4,6-dideoxygalactose transaminase
MKRSIHFNQPFIVGKELYYIARAVLSGYIAGDGSFTKKCHSLLEEKFNAKKILLTHSCTAALEMAAILINIKPNDEVILPSFSFVSTANAFFMRGAKLVFVDIRKDTLNIDETKIEAAITKNTKAIVPVHYAGVGCEMNTIKILAAKYGLYIIEDAAQGVSAKYRGKYLGTIGQIGTYSFHETKNFICGEGGAIVLNDTKFIERAEIIREKGTNRSKFFRGEVDKYSWVDVGSSYLPSELLAAFLYAQLENMEQINARRKRIFELYKNELDVLETIGLMQLPTVPDECETNFHLFYIILENEKIRDDLISFLKSKNILAVFHYLPLHLSPMGRSMGYTDGQLPITESLSNRLLRLPFYYDLTEENQMFIIHSIKDFFRESNQC